MGDFANNVILVVDDDEMNLNIARMVLEKKLNCIVLTATSGEQALDILNRQFVSLILLDVLMPEMDGIETLEKIRAIEKLEEIPVIMLTASVDKDVIKKSIVLGVKDYVKKPFMPKELIERVEKKLAESGRRLESVLIIDTDEFKIRCAKEFISEICAYRISATTSIAEGLEILATHNITIVIVGATMNFVDGLKILNFMANDSKFDNVPLIVSTPEKMLESINKIKNPQSPKAIEIEKDSAIIHSEKNRTANVVTSVIGYKLDTKI